jgi:hypothetical protein
MANVLGTRQWRLDTAAPGVVIWPANFKCKAVEFAGYGSQGNQLILKDQNGNIWCNLTGAADIETVRTPSDVGWVNGLIVDTLQGNGIATVYLA